MRERRISNPPHRCAPGASCAASFALAATALSLEHPEADVALCDFAANLRFADLPSDVLSQLKLSILDTLGVALAGARFGEGDAELRAYARMSGSRGGSTIWATGERYEPGLAALINAVHARALDYDDIIPFPQIHVSVHVVPAVLALAENLPQPVSGRDLIAATAIGCEIQSRLARAIAPFFGAGLPALLSSQIFGYFSSALACGRLIGLDCKQMRSAFGLALMHAAGTEEMVVHAANSVGKALYAGLSNQGGMQCALMASCGVRAEGLPLTGTAGLFAAYYGGRYDQDALTRHLASEFCLLDRCFKAAPGTLVGHSFAEAAANLVRKHAIRQEEISEIVLHVGSWGRAMCEPLELRRHPPSASAAMNSVPFVVAKTLANGEVRLDDFQNSGLSQIEAQRISARIRYVFSPGLSKPGGLEEGIVEFLMSDGRVLRSVVQLPLGHPDRPLPVEHAISKFRVNLAQSPRQSVIDCAGELAERIMKVEQEPDISALLGVLVLDKSGASA
jgi:2-methylcitrate dehydratase PrpD